MTEEMEMVPIRRNGEVGPAAILTQSSGLSMDWTCRRGSPVGGTSPLNVNKAAEQGEMGRKIEVCALLMKLVVLLNNMLYV